MRAARLAARALARSGNGAAPAGTARFSGYGLLSLAVESGDVFAFRHYAASSLGLPFNAVWHRDPAGCWTVHVDVTPGSSSAPFFAPAVADVRTGDIAVRWRGRDELSVSVSGARLHIAVRLAATPATRLLALATALLARAAWWSPALLGALGRAAAASAPWGPLQFAGRSPAGHGYRMRPAGIWQVSAASAVLAGRDLGAQATVADPLLLGGLSLPRRPLLAALTEEFRRPASEPGA